MTAKEAIAQIKSKPKWYKIVNSKGYVNSTTMANIARGILAGKCKPETAKKFFEHYGYEYSFKEEIIKLK